MDSMIKVEDVSMKFNLGIEKNFSLKLFFINMFKPKKKDEKKGNKDFWALKHVNFEVERGEVVGFVGGNGAGKSTLLKVVSGVMKPTEGKITVAGNICPMIELGAGFDMDLTARENIYLNGSILGYSREFIDQKFDENRFIFRIAGLFGSSGAEFFKWYGCKTCILDCNTGRS